MTSGSNRMLMRKVSSPDRSCRVGGFGSAPTPTFGGYRYVLPLPSWQISDSPMRDIIGKGRFVDSAVS
jgi:hypothetical protein